MAWVPGGKVTAKENGSPSFLACSTKGLIALGSAPTLPFHSLLRVIAWPLRLSSQGMIIGFFGEPARPMRSEEHTSELQSQSNLVCRLLLEKKKNASLLHALPHRTGLINP